MHYVNNSKDNNNILFNYFEDFDEFQKEIAEIARNSQKLQNFYNLYLLKKNIETKINESNGHNLVQNIVLNMKNNDAGDLYNNKIKIDNLIKIICLDKALNLITYANSNNNNIIINDNNNINNFIENISEDNIIYEILQLCQDKNYKNILNNKGEYPEKTFYEKTVKFLQDYFDNYIMPLENPEEVKENCYIILFLLNECIKNKKISYNDVKMFIAEICNKCIIVDNDYINNKFNDYDEDDKNENQKKNLKYKKTAELSIVLKLLRCFDNFKEIFLNAINGIKEDEMNKNEENRILYLLEFVNILNNLIKPEIMDNFNNNIDNKMEEEEEEIN